MTRKPTLKDKAIFLASTALAMTLTGYVAARVPSIDSMLAHMGKQPDGSFIVATEQRIEPGSVAFDGRPIDIALHPSGEFYAVLGEENLDRPERGPHASPAEDHGVVMLATRTGLIAGSQITLADNAAYRGAIWSPDGTRLFVSTSGGYVQELMLSGHTLTLGHRLLITPDNDAANPRPGGMCITRDGKTMYVAAADRNAVAQIDLTTDTWVREYHTQTIPFEVRLSADEKQLIASNWGGRQPDDDDEESPSGSAMIVVDPRGVGSSGTVSLINIATGKTCTVTVGLHPTSIAVDGTHAFVSNSASDTISEIDLRSARVVRTIPIKWGSLNLFGSMPNALAIKGDTIYACNGGDNAVCEIDRISGNVRGFRPAGFYPTGIQLSSDGQTAYVVNTKGNGSVRRTGQGIPGNVHDFQGTVSVVDLKADLKIATTVVTSNNHWAASRASLNPNLAVYHGAIKHVLYVIKENRTYDEVFGDMKEGNGDPSLCDLGEQLTPNAHALARQFTLFDNGYVSGTNSADGHAWSTQALCNDYMEHFYTGYRTYPDDGDCAMSRSSAGFLWDAAAKANVSYRDYGEYCDEDLASFVPKTTSWFDLWKDRAAGANKIKVRVATLVPGLKGHIHPSFVYWPLIQSDQARADLFIDEYQRFSKEDRVPQLMIMALPCDHTEGRNPDYPQPQCMVADNDLGLGRVVDAISHSPQWKDTCIFVIEDDAQSGPDHVDGHRTVYMAYSPYIKRHFVDHTMYNTVSMIRSIELMLGIAPMNKFDALTPPLSACFTDTPDTTPYTTTPANIALDQMNTPLSALSGEERRWTKVSMGLDWSGPDHADPQTLNEVLWHTMHGMNVPYPARFKQ